MVPARHGSELRGIRNVDRSSVANGRFGRLFYGYGPAQPSTNVLSAEEARKIEEALKALADTMIQGEFEENRQEHEKQGRPPEALRLDHPLDELEAKDENTTIPAGYTYLGQFIDHDITFDPVSSLQAFNDPFALEDFRTPRLDLDSIYGRGPEDQPYLYTKASERLKFLLGNNKSPQTSSKERPDLPRNQE